MKNPEVAMEELFSEWKGEVLKESDHFVEDGLISEESWRKAERKVLFILKETNDYRGDIAKLINRAVNINPKHVLWKRPTFHNIGRWSYGLTKFSNQAPCYKEAHKNRREALLSCAFINIKKTSGGRTAGKAVERSAEKYSVFLRKQIEILSPDIIVFGGTYKIMKDHVIPEMEKVSHRIHKFSDIVCINAYHPACTKKRTFMYDQVLKNYSNFVLSGNHK